MKSRGGKSQRREEKRRKEERRPEKRKSHKKQPEETARRKKMQVAKRSKKVAKHYVFTMFWGPGWSKSTLAKAAGVEPSG